MIYPLVKFGDSVLETPAETITEFCTPELQKLIADMFESMYAHRGVGLAAPQIGIPKRLTVVDCSAGEDPAQRYVLINPEILSTVGKQTQEEGCLSVPGFRERVTRAERVTVRAQDPAGKWFQLTGEGLLARVLLHETDHLNGVLYLSRLSALKRDLIRRKIRKLAQSGDLG